MHISDEGWIFGLVVGVLVAFAIYLLGALRNPASASVQNSQRISKVPTKLAPTAAFKVVVAFAQSSGYCVASIDEGSLRLCLEEETSFTTQGFFMPVEVVPGLDGGASVEVGTKSKTFQAGPVVTRAHEKCVSGLRAALFAAV